VSPSPLVLTLQEAQTPLSRAEFAVAELVADGLTNREIADRLFVSHRTVESHVSHALTKLGFSSRVQLARFVTEQQRATSRVVDRRGASQHAIDSAGSERRITERRLAN
jgi:DNA-binding NarL/FixJ family response regulator